MKSLAIAALLCVSGCASLPGSTATYSPVAPASTSAATASVLASPVTARPPYKGQIASFGDSIMLGAQPCLEPLGFTVDAVQGRTFSEGISAVENAAEPLPKRIVLGFGTNGPFTDEEFDSAMQLLSGHQVYWVSIHLPDEERYSFAYVLNGALRRNVDRYPNAHLIDWDLIADEHPEWLYDDGIHLRPEACQPYADVINAGARVSHRG